MAIDNPPLITVIIPVYNVENYLKQCVDSVINQTYKNLEIFLIDDGSTDSSGKICDNYAAIDDRIIVIHKKNSGQSDARNVGIKKAAGDFYFFVDSDDYLDLTAIQKLLEISISHNADLVIADIHIIYGDESPFLTISQKPFLTDYNSLSAAHNYVLTPWGPWNKLYKKHVHQNVFFPSGKIHEDEAIMFTLLKNSCKTTSTTEKLYYYRQRPNSTTATPYSIKKMDWFHAWEDNLSYIRLHFPSVEQQALDKFLTTALYNIGNIIKTNGDEKYYCEIIDSLKSNSKKIYFNKHIKLTKKLRTFILLNTNKNVYHLIYKNR